MVDRFICYLVIIMFPAVIAATALQWISIEVSLAMVWATTLLTVGIGLVEYWKFPEAYNSPGR